ncbi:hypothetical protein [Streptomyces hyaluromycini]|uniref:hypothetical protein n=1 Tax=Streptomyces hyaluromycini TaxID=1377993 RepID=UPI0011AE9E54|nr:hypothetical protein [Streptomyces hyaluromycini]
MTLGMFGTALAGAYTLTGLWTAHDSADRWAIAIAFAVAASGAVDKAVSPWADQAVPSPEPSSASSASGASGGDPTGDPSAPSPSGDPSAPSPSGDPSAPSPSGDPSGSPDGNPSGRTPEPSRPGRRVRARDRVTTAVVAVAVAATASGIVYEALAPDQGHAGTASSASASASVSASEGYTRVYAHRRLFLKDYHYYFDLRAGVSGPAETEWSISTNAGGDGAGAFEVQPLTDVYVVSGKAAPTAAQCAARAVHHPAEDRLHFRDAPPGRTFCLRDTTNGDIAVVTVLDVDHGNYATTDTVTYYRHRG